MIWFKIVFRQIISVVIDLKMGLGSHTDARYEWAEDWGWKDLQQENIWIEDKRWTYLQQETTGKYLDWGWKMEIFATRNNRNSNNAVKWNNKKKKKKKNFMQRKLDTNKSQKKNCCQICILIKLSSLIEKAVLRNKPNNQIKLQRGLMSKLSYSCSQPCQHDGDIIYAAFIRNLATVKTFKRRETSVKFHFILFT